jgi:hypothetical protein
MSDKSEIYVNLLYQYISVLKEYAVIVTAHHFAQQSMYMTRQVGLFAYLYICISIITDFAHFNSYTLLCFALIGILSAAIEACLFNGAVHRFRY